MFFIYFKEFDKKYNLTSHCIGGYNFGSYVTQEPRNFMYLSLGQVDILLFKQQPFDLSKSDLYTICALKVRSNPIKNQPNKTRKV